MSIKSDLSVWDMKSKIIISFFMINLWNHRIKELIKDGVIRMVSNKFEKKN